MAQNKFVKGLIFGALTGAALSLLDKDTRSQATVAGKKMIKKTSECLQNPQGLKTKVVNCYESAQERVANSKDYFSFLLEKVNELSEMAPQMVEMIKETKDSLLNSSKEKHIPFE